MDKQFRQEVFQQAQEWVLEAGDIIRKKMDEPLIIDHKANENDLVTDVDRAIEHYFINNIKATYPTHSLIGEESYNDDLITFDGTVWIIDPIDGTMNFVHMKKDFAISLGIFHNGVGQIGIIYDVMADNLYTAIKDQGAYENNKKLTELNQDINLANSILSFGHDLLVQHEEFDKNVMSKLLNNIKAVRMTGAASLDIAAVATGKLDAYIASRLSLWDFAAGMVIINEVGGQMSRSNGEEVNLLKTDTVICYNSAIKNELVSILQDWVK